MVDLLFQYKSSPRPKTAEKRGFCTCVTDIPTDRRTDRQTDRRSYRDAFLTDASKKRSQICNIHRSASTRMRSNTPFSVPCHTFNILAFHIRKSLPNVRNFCVAITELYAIVILTFRRCSSFFRHEFPPCS